MKKHFKTLLAIGIIAIGISSCIKKIDNSSTPGTSNSTPTPSSEYPSDLTTFNNIITNSTSKIWGEAHFELSGLGIQDCRNDDLMTLKNDGSYTYDNGAIVCGNDEIVKNGNWMADFNSKTITFDKGTPDEYTATIVSLSESQFSLKGKWNGLDINGTYKVQN